jgi:hypothetical protein
MPQSVITMNPMSYINLVVALTIVGLSGWYFFKGRVIDKWVMLSNSLAGTWASTTILLIIYDRFYHDVFVEGTTRWLISITLFVILATKLGNLIRIGRRHG